MKKTLPDNKSWQQNPEKYNMHRVQEITIHGGFIHKIWMNDIAIITVKKPFKFSHLIGEFIYLGQTWISSLMHFKLVTYRNRALKSRGSYGNLTFFLKRSQYISLDVYLLRKTQKAKCGS